MLERPPTVLKPAVQAPPLAIETRGLIKQFDRRVVLHDIDLKIPSGEIYGLIGPNGAGKTTLIRLLAGIEDPTLGSIYIEGVPLRSDRPDIRIQQRIGYLPDDFPVYDDLTVWDYLDYFARLYRLRGRARVARLYDVLDLVQLGHKRGDRVATLSRGMKQRLGLARAIVHEPLLLLLDEPVSGLDPLARQQFREIVKSLRDAGMTVLISSHVLSDLAELCTAIGVMELGYLVANAPLAEIYQKFSRQYLRVTTLGPMAALEAALKTCSGVTEWERTDDPGQVRVTYTGEPSDRAALLRSLVMAGVPVADFSADRDDLEAIFLQLGHQQSS